VGGLLKFVIQFQFQLKSFDNNRHFIWTVTNFCTLIDDNLRNIYWILHGWGKWFLCHKVAVMWL